VSARREPLWICASELSSSGGILRLSFTYFSKLERMLRTIASISTPRASISSIGSTSQQKNGAGCTKPCRRARFLPSTITLTVPSGSGTCWRMRPIVPTVWISPSAGSS